MVLLCSDFSGIVWDSGGVALNLNVGTQVVGQAVLGGNWGDVLCGGQQQPNGLGNCGDFNLFSGQIGDQAANGFSYENRGAFGDAPVGVAPFTLAAGGGAGESMILTSFIRAAAGPAAPSFAVPTLSLASLALFATAMLALGWIAVRTRG